MAKKITKKTSADIEAEVKTPAEIVENEEAVSSEVIDSVVENEKNASAEIEAEREVVEEKSENDSRESDDKVSETFSEKVDKLMADEPTADNIEDKIKKAEAIEEEIKKRNKTIKNIYGRRFSDFWNGVNNGWNN